MGVSLATLGAGLIAGLATSPHCTAMCGPLACALCVRPREYHVTRFLSYSLAGVLCGAIGQAMAAFLQGSTARIVPWVFALVLLAIAFGWERHLPQPRFAAVWLGRARLNRSLGWLTPLIPCGPLWLMLSAAAVTGSWWGGGLHMALFAAGTIPLSFFVQTHAGRLAVLLPSRLARWTRPSAALVSAGLLVWRATLSLHANCH